MNKMEITKTLWAATRDGRQIYKYRMTNAAGAYVELGSIGAGSDSRTGFA